MEDFDLEFDMVGSDDDAKKAIHIARSILSDTCAFGDRLQDLHDIGYAMQYLGAVQKHLVAELTRDMKDA